jgi:hypothetical protein
MRPRFVSEFARVTIDQHQAAVLQVFPYVTVGYDLKDRQHDHKMGADLYWKPSGDLQLTATLNPDFGQVEADELVVNFDAIETFFSDKRPFFTENQALFDLRTPDSGLLIYTRRIGGPSDDGSGRAAEIDAALKLTGSWSGIDYGSLIAQEADYADDLGALYYAQRMVVPGERLTLGYLGTYTDRPLLSREGLVQAVDATWRADDRWRLSAQALASDVALPGPDKRGQGIWTRIDYTPSPAWRQELELTHFDRTLDFNDMGFQRRPSLNELEWTVQHQENIDDPTSSLRGRNWRAEWQSRSNDSGARLPDVLILDHLLQFRSGAQWQFNWFAEGAGYNDLISRGNGLVRVPLRRSVSTEYETVRIGRWQFEFTLGAYEEGLGGSASSWGLGAQFFASDQLTIDGAWYGLRSHDWLIWEGGSLFGRYGREQVDANLNLNWFPAPKHEFRAKLQWLAISADANEARRIGAGGRLVASSETLSDFTVNNFGLQLRYRWEFAPQSDLYVVYGRGGFVERENDPDDDLGSLLDAALQLRDSDQILMKLRKRF